MCKLKWRNGETVVLRSTQFTATITPARLSWRGGGTDVLYFAQFTATIKDYAMYFIQNVLTRTNTEYRAWWRQFLSADLGEPDIERTSYIFYNLRHCYRYKIWFFLNFLLVLDFNYLKLRFFGREEKLTNCWSLSMKHFLRFFLYRIGIFWDTVEFFLLTDLF